MDTTKLDDVFVKRLQQKTGKEITLISELVGKINQHRKNINEPVETDLIEFDRVIETILEKNKS